jgi:hypothetical protein
VDVKYLPGAAADDEFDAGLRVLGDEGLVENADGGFVAHIDDEVVLLVRNHG